MMLLVKNKIENSCLKSENNSIYFSIRYKISSTSAVGVKFDTVAWPSWLELFLFTSLTSINKSIASYIKNPMKYQEGEQCSVWQDALDLKLIFQCDLP